MRSAGRFCGRCSAPIPRFGAYEFRCYQYPTAFVQLRVLRRIPRLKALGSGLRAFLEPLLRDRYITIKYMTRNSGFIEPRMNRPNEASPDFAGRWKDEGTSVYYQIHPRPGETYELD